MNAYAQKAAVAREVGNELRAMAQQLEDLAEDVRAVNLHRATLRLDRMVGIARTTAAGLKQQAGKLDGRGRNET